VGEPPRVTALPRRGQGDRLAAHLDWTRSDLLAVFPFRHRVEITVSLRPDSLILETALIAGQDETVPVSFGFHPYFGLPGVPRAEWRLELPAMRRLVLDRRGIPTGAEESFARLDAALGELAFDDGFALGEERATFSIAGGGWKVAVELLRGYRYAQIFAPRGKDFVALEPMTAPANALSSGRGIGLVKPGGRFEAAFRIHVRRDASQSSV
jgi:aldose 1-epimerase